MLSACLRIAALDAAPPGSRLANAAALRCALLDEIAGATDRIVALEALR